jgi:phosphopantothenoylcysteine synthetase/decarboxylase
MTEKRQRHVVLGVTGSIAAYKAAELVRLFRKRGWGVSVIMTAAATEFVTPLTFQTLSREPVGLGLFDEKDSWHPEHLSYAERADVLVIAPCTANVIAKLAHGLADDLLTCTALATQAPVVVAPAMNHGMWRHPATRENVGTLKRRGVRIVDVETGELACGVTGQGRLASVEAVMAAVDQVLSGAKSGKEGK